MAKLPTIGKAGHKAPSHPINKDSAKNLHGETLKQESTKGIHEINSQILNILKIGWDNHFVLTRTY